MVETNKDVKVKINADKAYITSNKYIYKNKRVLINTPIKQKSIKQTNKEIKTISNKLQNYKLKYEDKLTSSKKLQIIKTYEEKISALNKHITKCNTNINLPNINGTKRYLIENYFCSLKHIPKLYLRTDKLITTFITTLYIGFLYNYTISH